MCRHLTIGEALLLALCTLGATSTDADVPKRAPSGFMGMRGKKQGSEELVYEDFEKRAPGMGFQGMRGKKDDDVSLLLDEPEYYDKRSPGMGFQGMRGKKSSEGMYEDLNKRAPGMGFQGMRGKKDQNLLEDPEYFEKRAPGSGFQGVRGKKDPTDSYKRAPSMGFQGVRGKKEQNDLFNAISESNDGYKLGSMQMNENKYDNDDYSMPDMDDIWGEGFDKRAPSGFMGMRGKKAPSGFMGMRGKKAPSGFMGMRGKKAPSGFMGMRGKKGDVIDLDTFLESLEEEEAREQAGLRHLQDDQTAGNTSIREKRYKMKSNIKKAPSGFMGMRGKKWDTGPMGRGPQSAETL